MSDRNTIIRECIAHLKAVFEGPTGRVITHTLEALLSVPDQVEASEPSSYAHPVTPPDAQQWGSPIEGETLKGLKLPGDTPVRWTFETQDYVEPYEKWDFTSTWGLFYLPLEHDYYRLKERREMRWGNLLDGKKLKGLGLDKDTLICLISGSSGPYRDGEDILDHGQYRLPADHPYYQKADDWTPDERTVRACIEKVGAINSHGVSSAAKAALQSLLPPDPIAALIDEISLACCSITPGRAITSIVDRLVSEGRLTL